MTAPTPFWHEDGSVEPDRLKLYRQLFEKTPLLFVIFSLVRDTNGQVRDWKIEEVNPALQKILDVEPDQYLGVPASQYFQDSSDLNFVNKLINEVAQTGDLRQVERYLEALDRTILFTIQPLDDEFLMATGMDMTEHKKLIESLAENRQRLEFITAAARVGMWDWDLVKDVLEWNDQCKRLFGLPVDEDMTYEKFLGALHPDDRETVDQVVQASIDERVDYDTEFRVVWPDGSLHWIHARGRAFYDASGVPLQLSGVAIDVTRRRQAEIRQEKVAAMHQLQNELLDQLMNVAPVGIAMLEGPQHVYVLANPAYRRMIDGNIDPIGKTAVEIWPEAADLMQSILDRVYESGEIEEGVDTPFPVRRAGKLTIAYLTYTVTPYFNAAHEVEGTVALIQDNTAQVLARKQIELEQLRLETYVNSAPVGILLVDEEGRMVRANPVAEGLFGQPIPYGQPFERQRILKIRWPDGTPTEPRDLPLIRSALDGETFKNVELLIERDGAKITMLASSVPIFNPEGKVSGAVAVFQDVSERRKAVEDRMRAAAQIEVQHYLMQSREMERLQIAHQLHEGLLQDLIGLQLIIEETLDQSGDESRRNQMDVIKQNLSRQIRELRDYCYELRPPALAPFGLEKAIRSHVDTIRDKHPELNVHLDLLPDMQFLPETIRLALFRVYQEVINNVIRHSEASNVWIRFVFNNRETTLEIHDDGTGFRVPEDWVVAVRGGRLGLAAAEERVESVGGEMEISSRAGEGTTVEVTVPLPPP